MISSIQYEKLLSKQASTRTLRQSPATIRTEKSDVSYSLASTALSAALVSILDRIQPIDWSEYSTSGDNDKVKPPSEQVYILRTCERILEVASNADCPIVEKQEQIYCFIGTHYQIITKSELRTFLIESALRCDVPPDTAKFLTFVEKLTKQFRLNVGRVCSIVEPDTAFINLRNCTLFFDKTGHRFERHSSKLFIRYVLDFDYNPNPSTLRLKCF